MSTRAATIDAARLEQLASDPAIKSGTIARIFGVGRATFFTYLSQHEDLWNVYADARLRAGKQITKAHMLPRRSLLNADEVRLLEIVGTIAEPTFSAIRHAAIAIGIEEHRFAALFYNLEHEKHEIESREVGQTTHWFIRDRKKDKKGASNGNQ